MGEVVFRIHKYRRLHTGLPLHFFTVFLMFLFRRESLVFLREALSKLPSTSDDLKYDENNTKNFEEENSILMHSLDLRQLELLGEFAALIRRLEIQSITWNL